MMLNLQPGDQRRMLTMAMLCNQSIPDGQAAAHGSFMNWRARTINDALREKRPVSFLLDLLT